MPTQYFKEKRLIALLKVRNQEAFSEIYESYVKRIYRFIYFKVSSPELAEDLTSEVFLKTWQYLTQEEREVRSLAALLYRIARNCVIDLYRQQNKVQEVLVEESVVPKLVTAAPQELQAELLVLSRQLLKLKEEYREVIVLRYLDGLSIGEVAQILEKPKGAVRVLLHRALRTLREELK